MLLKQYITVFVWIYSFYVGRCNLFKATLNFINNNIMHNMFNTNSYWFDFFCIFKNLNSIFIFFLFIRIKLDELVSLISKNNKSCPERKIKECIENVLQKNHLAIHGFSILSNYIMWIITIDLLFVMYVLVLL